MKFDKEKLKETILRAALAAVVSVIVRKLVDLAAKQVLDKDEDRSDRASN